MNAVNDFFDKNDHKALIYFCFGDDGYSRHRKIVFNMWARDLDSSIDKYNSEIPYEGSTVYGSLLIVNNNPLKELIVKSFEGFISELTSK